MSASRVQGPLADSIAAFAGLPDDNVTLLDHSLQRIVQLTVSRVKPVDYASVTAHRKGGLTTVAMSNDLALAVDEAQYAADDGPCLDALASGTPFRSDIATTINWPRFRHEAAALGLSASLSIPLFAGRGSAVAALNLYARDAASLDPVTRAVLHVFELHEHGVLPMLDQLDDGSAELVSGVSEAFEVQQRIQIAIGLVMQTQQVSADGAYLRMREQSVLTDVSLLEAADEITARLSPRSR
jgi:X-X-X-Leu-X-X-Gly heptad repeat protein